MKPNKEAVWEKVDKWLDRYGWVVIALGLMTELLGWWWQLRGLNKSLPAFPKDGVRSLWLVEGRDSNGAVVVDNWIPQSYFKDTAYPKRTFGTNWHYVNGQIRFQTTNEEGQVWSAVFLEGFK